MEEQAKLRGMLLAHHQVLAILLARYGLRTGRPLAVIHSGAVNQIIRVCSTWDAGPPELAAVAGPFEAGAVEELDSIFSMATAYQLGANPATR